MKTSVLVSVLFLCATGCGPRHAVTGWGYSHWYRQTGGASMGAFDEQQKLCLEQAGITGDAASVEPNSPEENAFLECMNGSGWCTSAFHCDKPEG